MAKIRFKIDQPAHRRHLCYLVNLRYHETHPDAFAQLIRESRYVCKHCGRTAARREHLCKPVKL